MWFRFQVKTLIPRNRGNPAAIFHCALETWGISWFCAYKGSNQIYIHSNHMHQLIKKEKNYVLEVQFQREIFYCHKVLLSNLNKVKYSYKAPENDQPQIGE
jgi:hypothetical protein